MGKNKFNPDEGILSSIGDVVVCLVRDNKINKGVHLGTMVGICLDQFGQFQFLVNSYNMEYLRKEVNHIHVK
jgi:hypothetical protein